MLLESHTRMLQWDVHFGTLFASMLTLLIVNQIAEKRF